MKAGFLFGDEMGNPFVKYHCSAVSGCRTEPTWALSKFEHESTDSLEPEIVSTVYHCDAHIQQARELMDAIHGNTTKSPVLP
jgi:hypothetical protein